MSRQTNSCRVAVNVATLWTAPDSPGGLDQQAIQAPARVREWLGSLNYEGRIALYDRNAVQTQALYGTQVTVLEESGEWVRIAVPCQPTAKDERGYPGWVPRVQLVSEAEYVKLAEEVAPNRKVVHSLPKACVTSPTAWVYVDPNTPQLEVSFVTEFPLLGETGEWLHVLTPHGVRLLRSDDAVVLAADSNLGFPDGEEILAAAKKFLDLPYLWGGMSAFGYDCSGFAYSMHRAFGIIIPRDASEQAIQGRLVNQDQLMPGDLLVFAYQEGKGSVHHVGFYAGEGQMLHSPKTGKNIELIPLAGTIYERELCAARRYWQ
ncbi:C40 family peptidase [Aneurinibacillus sp. Ricciae_BoGa-3]|uniref:C40 family peptidase n=1 Tax=Aneurinibacillus sp. Ricciae_BoGa-3 TaxID=3022697 RepID=UPI002340EC59|nr:C40 family peptidase [Aneurinibacillus sp. Ricciae_BoGa-3]WCK55571.1 C40 family peptidase [Aneurinibacillus sp. Ricciae_BoGa-3]